MTKGSEQEYFTGSIGDSDYVRESHILEQQECFVREDIAVGTEVVSVANVFDKGYRVVLDCLNNGKQRFWQPVFTRSDERCGSFPTILTAVVAFVRSGNERSVKHVKHSKLIVVGAKGKPTFDLDMLSDLWLAWGYQINFMYEPVH